MKALIIAGDEGARMRPITLLRPASMTEILGVPLLEHIIYRLVRSNIKEICIRTGFMPGEISGCFETGEELGLKELYYINEKLEKGLKDFADGDSDILVIDSSVAENTNYDELLKVYAENKKRGVPITLSGDSVAIFSCDDTDGLNSVASCIKTFESGGETFTSVVKLKYPGRFEEWEKECYRCLLDTPGDYINVNLAAASGRLENGVKAAYGEVTIGETSVLPDSVKLSGAVFIGENCIIGKNVTLCNCVIGDGCIVRDNTVVSGSVLLKNVRVAGGCKLFDSVICGQAMLDKQVSCEECVIGSAAVLGKGATVCRGVRIWPSVEVEPETVVRRSIIGAAGSEELVFRERGIDGELLTKRLPSETMTRLGCAVGNVFGFSATIVVCSNAHGASQMLSSAVISGLMSTGIKVRQTVDVELPVIRWVCRNGAADGAVYIDNRGELMITLLDKHGNDLPRGMRKKVQRAYSCDEFTISAETDMIPPEPLSDPEDYYVADIGKQFPYAYRAFRLRSFTCERERREALTAYIIGRLYPEAPVFVSVNSALAAKSVADKLNCQVIKCGEKVGDVMEAMEPFMKLPGVYCQYLMLYDDFAFELALCHYKAVTGEDADSPENPLLQNTVVKKQYSVACDNLRKGEILRRISKDFVERFGDADNAAGREAGILFSCNERGAVRISADERRPAFNISVESFEEEYAEDIMSGLSEFLADAGL